MREITVDFETFPFQPRLPAPTPVALAWFDGQDSGILKRQEAYKQLAEWLEDEETVLIWHYAAFDMSVLAAHQPQLLPAIFREYEEGRVKCTMYREKLLDLGIKGFMPRGAYGLDKIVKRRWAEDLSEGKHGKFSWRKRYHFLDHLSVEDWPQEAVEYILSDVYWTHRLYQAQKEPQTEPMTGMVVAGSEGIQNETETACASFGLSGLASTWGLLVDQERAAKVERDLQAKVDAAMAQLKLSGIYRENGSKDMKALRARIKRAYEAQGKQPPITNPDNPNKKSSIKYDEDTLAESGDPILELMASISSEEKLLSSFTDTLKAETVHPGYDALKHTGRSSSFKPNIQQMPRDGGIRECFIARPGYLLVMCDYSTLELRALAQVVLNIPSIGWSRMADALKDGKDLHLQLGASILGISYEEALEMMAAGEKAIKDARQLAKVPNFGIPGGMTSPYSLVDYAKNYGIDDMTVGQAQRLMDHWWRTWPEMEEYFAWIDAQSDFNGDSTVVQHFSGRIRAKTRKTAAANSYFQGLAADGMRYALWQVLKECYTVQESNLYGSRVNANVHDELVAEVPICNWRPAALRLQEVMESTMAQYIPDIPIIAEPAVAARWYKSAEPVYDEAGVLHPWYDPKEEGSLEELEAKLGQEVYRHAA